jgi:hypothetical protein
LVLRLAPREALVVVEAEQIRAEAEVVAVAEEAAEEEEGIGSGRLHI